MKRNHPNTKIPFSLSIIEQYGTNLFLMAMKNIFDNHREYFS